MSTNNKRSANKTDKPVAKSSDPGDTTKKVGLKAGVKDDNSPQPKPATTPVTARKLRQKAATVVNKTPKVVDPRPAIKHSKSEIEHLQSEIKMEVHHHPDLKHKHKPIKEYLLEGLMIFIAVMMGFVAENIREAIDNSLQAKHLTEQLVHDLQADTAQLNQLYQGGALIVKYNDTLFNLLQQPMAKADIGRIQKQAANSHSIWLFHPSSGAIAAIKNQLHLKQFSNSDIINYFAKYERHIELLHTDQDIALQYQRIYLDPFITQHFTPANLIAAFDNSGHPTTQVRNLNQADLDQLASDMVLIRIVNKNMLRDNRLVKADAVDLLKYVKKRYGVDGE